MKYLYRRYILKFILKSKPYFKNFIIFHKHSISRNTDIIKTQISIVHSIHAQFTSNFTDLDTCLTVVAYILSQTMEMTRIF